MLKHIVMFKFKENPQETAARRECYFYYAAPASPPEAAHFSYEAGTGV